MSSEQDKFVALVQETATLKEEATAPKKETPAPEVEELTNHVEKLDLVKSDTKPSSGSWADDVEEEEENTTSSSTSAASADKKDDAELEKPTDEKTVKASEVGYFYDENITEVVVQTSDPGSIYTSTTSFDELNLSKELREGITLMKFSRPSKIQEKVLPIILSQRTNLIAQGQSGTGKTAAFTLGILSRVNTQIKKPQALCIVPTRELAFQAASVIKKIGVKIPNLDVFVAVSECVKPDGNITSQVIVGTPGKILDLMRHILPVQDISIIVIDEADHMLKGNVNQLKSTRGGRGGRGRGGNNNFQPLGNQVKSIMDEVKYGRSAPTQILCFSATWPDSVTQFAEAVVSDPKARILLKKTEVSIKNLKQYYVHHTSKYEALTTIYGCTSIAQSIIFVQTRAGAFDLKRRMTADGFEVSVIVGTDMEPAQRDRVLADFRAQKTNVLIATDVLSRGIDVPSVNLVVNYDMPQTNDSNPRVDEESYIHRIGRTARFQKSGLAISLVDSRTISFVRQLETEYDIKIKRLGFEELPNLPKLMKEVSELGAGFATSNN